MKDLKRRVVERGWATIEDEHFGTILISKNIFNWFTIEVTNDEKDLELHTVMVVKTWSTIRKWLSKHHIAKWSLKKQFKNL
tara:strand:+ start:110 stop:352 length:243 start_codon:yes stop_codon:yes gene_type:complete